jgi:2-polyprenyl-3-methyl-5-hydroxy-6-metoxy-1,4-benzoquinol methylase
MNQRIEKILQYTKGPRVLDVGCVGGKLDVKNPYWLHAHLLQNFEYVIGVDINQEAINTLKQLGYNVLLRDAQKLDLNEKFDTIVAGELIEHLSNPGQFLEAAKCLLNKDGRIILTTPYVFGLANVIYALAKFPKTCSNSEHTVWFCVSTLSELARRHGFKIAHWELIEDYYEEVPSLKYRILVAFLKLFGYFLPKRVKCNAMLFILQPDNEL